MRTCSSIKMRGIFRDFITHVWNQTGDCGFLTTFRNFRIVNFKDDLHAIRAKRRLSKSEESYHETENCSFEPRCRCFSRGCCVRESGGNVERKRIDKLTIALGAFGTEAIDPVLGILDDKPYLRLMYNYVIDTDLRDKDPSKVTGLAKDWKWSADRKALRVFLRKGVKFHNGAEVKAEDVVFFPEADAGSRCQGTVHKVLFWPPGPNGSRERLRSLVPFEEEAESEFPCYVRSHFGRHNDDDLPQGLL